MTADAKLLPIDLYETLLMQARSMGWQDTRRHLERLEDAPSYVHGGSWLPPSINPDVDGRLWPIAFVPLNDRTRRPEMAFEYYHFDNGWATDDRIVAWWNQPVAPFADGEYSKFISGTR